MGSRFHSSMSEKTKGPVSCQHQEWKNKKKAKNQDEMLKTADVAKKGDVKENKQKTSTILLQVE